ncbi:hypothetical protein U1Q18_027057 [Sarracenia purpurea var. burkii]
MASLEMMDDKSVTRMVWSGVRDVGTSGKEALVRRGYGVVPGEGAKEGGDVARGRYRGGLMVRAKWTVAQSPKGDVDDD